MLPVLYKRNAKQQLQQWSITVDGDGFFTEEGIVGGAITKTLPTICLPKNVGKANATTPAQQAEKQAQAKWQKKIDKGYRQDPDANDCTTTWPMLATEYKKLKSPPDFPVMVQRKFDGIRCIARQDGLWSRGGKPFASCRHLEAALKPFFESHPDAIFDGELYNHEYHDDFNEIASLVKSVNLTDEERANVEKMVEYHVYDYPSCAGDFPFRSAMLRVDLPEHPMLKHVETLEAYSTGELDVLYAAFLDEGYEGQMVRLPGPYQFEKRSKYLLKRKETITDEFPIVRIEAGVGNASVMAARVYCSLPDGREFKANLKLKVPAKKKLLTDAPSLIGQMATVEFHMYTPAGKPRCGRMLAVRDYE